MKKSLKFVIPALIILMIALIYNAVVITAQDEYSVIKFMNGKVLRVEDTAGSSLKVPFLHTKTTMPKSVLIYDLPKSAVITKDKKTMETDCFVLYKIENPVLFIQKLNGSIGNAEARIDTTVFNAVKTVISSTTQDDVISGRDGQLVVSIRDNIGDKLTEYGIDLIGVETKHLDLPDNNKTSVYNRMIAEREDKRATYIAEGEAEKKKIETNTDATIRIMESQAKAEADATIAEGEAEYMNILSKVYNTPEKAEFYNFVRALDMAKISYSGGNKTLILSSDSPLAEIFNTIE